METTTKSAKASKSTKSRTTKVAKNTAESAPVAANNIELITSEKVEPEPTAQPVPPVKSLPPVEPLQPEPSAQPQQEASEKKEIRLIDVPVTNENVALNLMVGFLNTAHKRGAFTIDESAKIWECIQKFQR
jgi:hypothetical protein